MSEIKRNRPLPRHTKLNYDECYAKIVLEKFFPEEYQDLQISDRPDLRAKDGSVGIEVTCAIPQKELEMIALSSDIPYVDKKTKEKRIAYLEKNGYKYSNYVLVYSPNEDQKLPKFRHVETRNNFCTDFISAVKNKIRKLNSGSYDLLPRYDLFVQSELYIEEWMLEKLIDKLCLLSVQPHNYTFIYLLALNGLFIFDIASHKYSVKETGKKLWGLGNIAYDMVEKGETDSQ